MLFSLLVTLREGIEIALVVTILLGYLRNINQKRYFRQVWTGVVLAALLSLAFGAALEITSRELSGRVLEAFEGFTMLFAVAVLTWMVFWMKRQSAGISLALRSQIDSALSRGSVMALALLAFGLLLLGVQVRVIPRRDDAHRRGFVRRLQHQRDAVFAVAHDGAAAVAAEVCDLPLRRRVQTYPDIVDLAPAALHVAADLPAVVVALQMESAHLLIAVDGQRTFESGGRNCRRQRMQIDQETELAHRRSLAEAFRLAVAWFVSTDCALLMTGPDLIGACSSVSRCRPSTCAASFQGMGTPIVGPPLEARHQVECDAKPVPGGLTLQCLVLSDLLFPRRRFSHMRGSAAVLRSVNRPACGATPVLLRS